jgi:hypothetical protein
MGEKVQLDEHGWVDRLLPWFVNNTLDDGEHDRVRNHLNGCDACRQNVSLLSAVQASVRHATATPMVPPPRTGRLIDAIDSMDRKRAHVRTLATVALAASLAGVLVAITLVLPDRQRAPTQPARYETTTSPTNSGSMDYVLDLQFEPGIPVAAQERALRRLAAKEINRSGAEGAYRVTVNLPATSLEELERYTRDLESSGAIKTVTAVAVQIPVKPLQ